jgi:hypothetical protein
MAERTAYVALRREARILDPRAVQSRLMTGLALAAAGGLLGLMLLTGAGIEDEADTLESVWARTAPGAVACRTADLPEGAEVYPPPQDDRRCVAERHHLRVPAQGFAAAEPAAALPRPPERTSRAPTYVRIRKPQPRPDPAEVLLEGLRGRL